MPLIIEIQSLIEICYFNQSDLYHLISTVLAIQPEYKPKYNLEYEPPYTNKELEYFSTAAYYKLIHRTNTQLQTKDQAALCRVVAQIWKKCQQCQIAPRTTPLNFQWYLLT
jgi:hypothetical protein